MSDELSVLREHLERYRAVTLQTLDLLSDDQLKWRPAADRRSLGEEFVHIADIEQFYFAGLLHGSWEEVSTELQGETLKAPIRKLLSSRRAETLTWLANVGPERLGEPVSVPRIPVNWPLRSWLWYVVEHEIHHKAVLATHLRSVGIEPPFFAFVMPRGVRPDRNAGARPNTSKVEESL